MQSGYVYIMNAVGTNFYKVGITENDVAKRLKQLQTGCPYRLRVVGLYLCDDPYDKEQQVLNLFSEARVQGEWLELENEARIFHVLSMLTSNMIHDRPIILRAEVVRSARYAEVNRIASIPHASSLIKLILMFWAMFLPTAYNLVDQDRTEAEKFLDEGLKLEAFWQGNLAGDDRQAANQRPLSQDEIELQRFWGKERGQYQGQEQYEQR